VIGLVRKLLINTFVFPITFYDLTDKRRKQIMKTHKDLDLWKDSMNMVVDIYHITHNFPKEELYGLTSQIRRAAISIPANISEGSAKNYPADFIRYLRIAQGSLSEFETLLLIAFQLNYLDDISFKTIQGKLFKINAQLSGLIKSIPNKPHT
jgi:four helix bundle protein